MMNKLTLPVTKSTKERISKKLHNGEILPCADTDIYCVKHRIPLVRFSGKKGITRICVDCVRIKTSFIEMKGLKMPVHKLEYTV